MKYLLDTNIISELRKPMPHPSLITWFDFVPEVSLYISVITIGEIRKGIENKRIKEGDASVAILENWFGMLQTLYMKRIIPIDKEVGNIWGKFLAINSHHAIDALLAATAGVHDMTLVTRNTKHVEMYDVPLLNPFL